MQKGVTKALVNTALVMPADFTRNADLRFPLGSMEQEIRDAVSPGDAEFLDATKLATGLMGDSIATNLFMVGYAYQRGPAAAVARRRSCARSSSTARPSNRTRKASAGAASPRSSPRACWPRRSPPTSRTRSACPTSLDEIDHASRGVSHRLPGRSVRQALPRFRRPRCAPPKPTRFRARLRSPRPSRATTSSCWRSRTSTKSRAFIPTANSLKRVAAQFEGDYKLRFHLAPPLTNAPDAETGEAKKSSYGPWMMSAFRVLAKLKGLRGTALDVFGRTAERRTRTPAHYRLRSADRGTAAASGRAQSRHRRRAREHSRTHPRLRPRQGSPSQGREGEGSRPGGRIPQRPASRSRGDDQGRRLGAGTTAARRPNAPAPAAPTPSCRACG